MRLKNSALVLESAWKQPFTLLVIVVAPCFCTPRITMHMWLIGHRGGLQKRARKKKRKAGQGERGKQAGGQVTTLC